MKKIINELNQEIQEIFSNAQSKEQLYRDVAIMCKEWFNISEKRKEYKEIQKALKLRNKNNI